MDDAKLEELVRRYWKEPEHGRSLNAYLGIFKKLSLPDAIKRSGYKRDGKVHAHQRLVGRKRLDQAANAILRNIDEIKACNSFDELHACIEHCTKRIHGFGVLARYDISLRIGASCGLRPECVYLHAGTKKGCKKLGVNASGEQVQMTALPTPMQKMEPHHAENFLCIYEDSFSKSGRTLRSGMPRRGVC
jgi:hypothetical protein